VGQACRAGFLGTVYKEKEEDFVKMTDLG